MVTEQGSHVAHPWVAESEQRVRFGIAGGGAPNVAAHCAYARKVEALGFDSY